MAGSSSRLRRDDAVLPSRRRPRTAGQRQRAFGCPSAEARIDEVPLRAELDDRRLVGQPARFDTSGAEVDARQHRMHCQSQLGEGCADEHRVFVAVPTAAVVEEFVGHLVGRDGDGSDLAADTSSHNVEVLEADRVHVGGDDLVEQIDDLTRRSCGPLPQFGHGLAQAEAIGVPLHQ
jgi:hypothetical protein